MKRLIFYFIILFLAVCLGIIIHNHPGYVYVNVGHTSFETTLWFAVFAILLAFAVIYLVFKCLNSIFSLPGKWYQFRQKRQAQKGSRLSEQAMENFIIGNYSRAESYFVDAAQRDHARALNYLGAAQSADYQKNFSKRNGYLNQAAQTATATQKLPVGILGARCQIAQAEYAAALKTLDQLAEDYPKHPAVLAAYEKAYWGLQNWEALHQLLPDLRRYKALPADTLQSLEKQVYLALLTQAGNQEDPARLKNLWREMSPTLQKDATLLSIYVKYLIQASDYEKAEQLLKTHLKTSLEKPLLEQYAQILSAEPSKQLANAESWLKPEAQDPFLLLCLGQLCMRHRLWGKARSYLEASIKHKPCPEAYQALGSVLEQLGEKTSALQCYRSGLQLLA
ncbi:MAG: heme biosynthesis HemY N-terminal domain-containing protein [Gammaproteobacteria bacterium]